MTGVRFIPMDRRGAGFRQGATGDDQREHGWSGFDGAAPSEPVGKGDAVGAGAGIRRDRGRRRRIRRNE